MVTLVKFDETYFAMLVDVSTTLEQIQEIQQTWAQGWPGTKLFVIRAERVIDMTGKAIVVERK